MESSCQLVNASTTNYTLNFLPLVSSLINGLSLSSLTILMPTYPLLSVEKQIIYRCEWMRVSLGVGILELGFKYFVTGTSATHAYLKKKIYKNILFNHLCIYLTTPPWAGYDTINFLTEYSWFKFRFFFFSETGCLTKTKESCLPYYLPISEEENNGFIPFFKGTINLI